MLLELFHRYASGQPSTRGLAVWLNDHGHRTTRGALFCADTVRDMLGNASYCGYVCAQRDRSKSIRGRHEPIIDEALFDQVQDIRRRRTTTNVSGRPSKRYVLKGIARCERCQGPMQGTGSGRHSKPTYVCATRRKRHTCDQVMAPAQAIEQQIVEFLTDFQPTAAIREEILRRLSAGTTLDDAGTARQRAQLEERRRRLRDLYEIGDLDRSDYLTRRRALDTDLDALSPGPAPDLDEARRVLEDFTRFWQHEQAYQPRQQLLTRLFDRVWIDDKRIVAVHPKPAFASFFQSPEAPRPPDGTAMGIQRERRGSNPRPPACSCPSTASGCNSIMTRDNKVCEFPLLARTTDGGPARRGGRHARPRVDLAGLSRVGRRGLAQRMPTARPPGRRCGSRTSSRR